MIGIVSFSAYIPFHRLQRSRIADAFGDRAIAGEKAVANYDEDSVSMAVNAGLDCIRGRDLGKVETLFFATTTASYKEKQASSTMQAALDLPSNIRAMDITGSLRASSSAFLSALDAVNNDSGSALVLAADCRLAAPQGSQEQLLGDGAAAFLFGKGEQVVAEVIGALSYSEEQLTSWRSGELSYLQTWEDRFVQETYTATLLHAGKQFLEKSGLVPSDFAKVIVTGPSVRAQMGVAGKLGFQKEQFQDPLVDAVGMTGTAHAPMMLAAALESAAPGDRILLLNYGEGCDVIAFGVTEAINEVRTRSVKQQLGVKSNQLKYADYLKWKGLLDTEPPRRPETPRPSVTAMQRNYHQTLGLYGSRCTECGTPQFPKQRVCAQCQAKDQMEDYRFYGKTAKVATFTIDYLAASPAPPTVLAVVDFDGGGRMLCEVTDCNPSEMQIGLELEMTFRRLYEAGGIHNYFWKAVPKRREGR